MTHFRHRSRANASYLDGHVNTLRATNIDTRLPRVLIGSMPLPMLQPEGQ